jgi:serine/threonine-protein kinase
MVKALHMHLVETLGPVKADAWLFTIHMLRDDLADETRPVPLVAVRDALAEFAKFASRDAIPNVWKQLVRPENLGYWMRVLRGTHVPSDAFGRIGGQESEYGRTTRWETLETRRGYWRGRVQMAHDPALEENGLLSLLRAAELRAVPVLFGYGPGEVVARGVVASLESNLAQDYEVRWKLPGSSVPTTIGAALGVLAGAGYGVAMGSTTTGAVSAAVLALAGGATGFLIGRDRQRRCETRAQSTRVHALERSLTLKERVERHAAGNLEGTIIAGQYRIKQRMGSGASGVIYEAARVRDGLPVAVKMLRVVHASDTMASDRLRREAETLSLSWHPNVVERIDSGVLPDGTTYLVLELLRGDTLAGRLKARGRIPADDLYGIALQICDALGAIHAAGVVHRDLKPSNIFLAKQPDGTERVKVIDFGIARVEWEETRITHVGLPVGTPGYMSPEQEVGGTIDARSDLYAFGTVLFECLVGEPPPPTPSGLWLAHPQTPAEGIAVNVWLKAVKFVPPVWQAVLDRAMAGSPGDRFPDARSFAQAIRDAQRNHSLGGGM